MNRVLSVLVALAFLGLPAGAVAQSAQTNAPPGNSAIDEYLETVPGVSGSQETKPPSSGGGATSPGGSATPTLTPAQRADLERRGADGRALADVVEQTSPGAPAQQPRVEAVPDGKGRSPLTEAFEVATGSDGGGGMGALLPVILLAALLGCIALVVLRRRSAS